MVLLAQLAAAAVLYLGGSGQLAEQAVRSHHADVGTTMIQLTRRWLGAPYRAFSLDQSPQERLQVDLQGFDCFLLVEQALALARSHTKQSFERELQQLRYGGRATNYCHRQHYFSRWAQTATAMRRATRRHHVLPTDAATTQPRLLPSDLQVQHAAPCRTLRNHISMWMSRGAQGHPGSSRAWGDSQPDARSVTM